VHQLILQVHGAEILPTRLGRFDQQGPLLEADPPQPHRLNLLPLDGCRRQLRRHLFSYARRPELELNAATLRAAEDAACAAIAAQDREALRSGGYDAAAQERQRLVTSIFERDVALRTRAQHDAFEIHQRRGALERAGEQPSSRECQADAPCALRPSAEGAFDRTSLCGRERDAQVAALPGRQRAAGQAVAGHSARRQHAEVRPIRLEAERARVSRTGMGQAEDPLHRGTELHAPEVLEAARSGRQDQVATLQAEATQRDLARAGARAFRMQDRRDGAGPRRNELHPHLTAVAGGQLGRALILNNLEISAG
jgi:hypothetical protein